MATLDLCCRLLLDDGSLRLILGGEEQHPHEPAVVVDEQQDVATPSWRCQGDWAAEVPMNQLQGFLRPIACLLGKGQAPLLPGKTRIAQLVGVLDVR